MERRVILQEGLHKQESGVNKVEGGGCVEGRLVAFYRA